MDETTNWLLLNEIRDFINSEDGQHKGVRALYVYNKCLRKGKVDLANKIKEKYGLLFPKSDMIMALGLCLLCEKI